MTELFPKITVDVDRRVISVGEIQYSIELLAGGFSTKPNEFVQISVSEPQSEGVRQAIFTSYTFDGAMQKVRGL